VTVLEVIQRSTDFLSRKGVDSPRLQAELLLAHVLQLQRMQLYLKFERELSVPEQDQLREMVKRRGEREPLQHIVGSTSFCGLEICVNKDVLIPRPETEILAEQGWLFLNRIASTKSQDATGSGEVSSGGVTAALDFGTGSGCLAIALAVKCPATQVLAVDISPEALQMAAANARRNGVEERIRFVPGSGFSELPPGSRFDLVVSNPPYIPSDEIPQLEPEVRQHDPVRALDGGPDGLRFFRLLASEAAGVINPAGKIMVEFGDGEDQAVAKIFEDENWVVEQILKDYTQRPRILIAGKRAIQSGSKETHG
jgi:release factor glutamine methyltransferase